MPEISNIKPTNYSQYLPFSHLLTEEEIALIEKNINVVKYKKKDVIFKQDTRTSNLLFIKSGLVKIYKEGRNERVIILNLVDSKKFIGLLSVFGESLYHYSAEAVTEAEICDLDLRVFKEILQGNSNYNFSLLKKISAEGLFIFDRLLGLSHKQLPGRIADVLLYFSEDIYKTEDFSFPLSRKELADFAGTTKESFIRTLTEFKNDKIIEIDGAGIVIKSMAIVRTLSQLG